MEAKIYTCRLRNIFLNSNNSIINNKCGGIGGKAQKDPLAVLRININNRAEGQSKKSLKETSHFLSYSNKSAQPQCCSTPN